MQRLVSHEAIDSTAVNRLAMLQLESDTIANHRHSSSTEDNVVFADPCSACGTKKRRLFSPPPLQEPNNSNPLDRTSIPQRTQPNLISSGTFTLSASATKTTTPLSPTSSSSSLPDLRRSNTFPVSRSPTLTPPRHPVVANLNRLLSFSGSSGSSQASPQSSSPSGLPPRAPIYRRSVSNVSTTSTTNLPTYSSEKFFTCQRTSTDTESSNERRKSITERLGEMNTWINQILQEEERQISSLTQEGVSDDGTMGLTNVRVESDGNDLFRVHYKCGCGRGYHVAVQHNN